MIWFQLNGKCVYGLLTQSEYVDGFLCIIFIVDGLVCLFFLKNDKQASKQSVAC